jgi:hypothetical protein
MIQWKGLKRVGVFALLLLLGGAGDLWAVYIDDARTLEVLGKAQTRTSIRLQDSDGFTHPLDVHAGNLVQWRNLAVIEINHDLMNLTYDLGILYPLKALDISAKYRLVGRFLYEAVYNVGPQAFQDVRATDKENIDSFKQSYDLWEFYVDLSRGPLFLRLGKQNLAWGETDTFRLLDAINPLDNTFGGPFEDLDDRRIPLWMLRGSYNFGTIGFISSAMIEAFWVPGTWDVTVAPYAPSGTAYAAPIPDTGIRRYQVRPDKGMSNSRWGVRVMGVLGNNLNFTLAHYKTFLDMPTARLGVDPGTVVVTGTSSLFQELIWSDVQITGASFNYCDPTTDIIFRGEAAWFWDEAVFIPEVNLKQSDTLIPLPPELIDLISEATGTDLEALGITALPINPTGGTVPEKNILRYMIGFDKYLWLRPLNPRTTFMVSAQYFGQWIPDYDKRQKQLLALYPKPTDFAGLRETEHTFTFLTRTNYMNGVINPQLVVAYDVRGAWLLMPSVMFLREPFRFHIQYSGVVGAMTNFGAFRDRDQISFSLTYLLN